MRHGFYIGLFLKRIFLTYGWITGRGVVRLEPSDSFALQHDCSLGYVNYSPFALALHKEYEVCLKPCQCAVFSASWKSTSKESHCLENVFSFQPGRVETLQALEPTRSGFEALLCDHGQVKSHLWLSSQGSVRTEWDFMETTLSSTSDGQLGSQNESPDSKIIRMYVKLIFIFPVSLPPYLFPLYPWNSFYKMQIRLYCVLAVLG